MPIAAQLRRRFSAEELHRFANLLLSHGSG